MSVHKTSTSAPEPPKHALLKPPPTPSGKKRKKDVPVIGPNTDPDDTSAEFKPSTKKAKLGPHDDTDAGSALVTKLELGKKKRTKGDKDISPKAVKTKGKSGGKEATMAKRGKKRAAEPVVNEDEDGDGATEDSERGPSLSGSDEDDDKYVPPVHESLAGAASGSVPPSKKNGKYVPPDETPDQRDSRTIFVGNVSSRVMTTKVSLTTDTCWQYSGIGS